MKLTPWKLPTRPTRLHGNGPRGNAAGCVATSHIIARQWHTNMRTHLCCPSFSVLDYDTAALLDNQAFYFFLSNKFSSAFFRITTSFIIHNLKTKYQYKLLSLLIIFYRLKFVCRFSFFHI